MKEEPFVSPYVTTFDKTAFTITLEKKASKQRIIIDSIRASSNDDNATLDVYRGSYLLWSFSAGQSFLMQGQNLFIGEVGETIIMVLTTPIQAGNGSGGLSFSGRLQSEPLVQRMPSHSGMPMPGTGIRPPSNRKPTLLQRIADKIDKGFKKGGL